MVKIYISGQITGIETQAPALFEAAQIMLEKNGYHVVNPMKLEHNHEKTWDAYMREDIKAMMDCTEVYMLENWLESKGAKIEHEIASLMNMRIIYQKI